MAIYRYDSGSLLDEVRIIKNSAGGLRACLHARTDASPEQLSAIAQHLAKLGLKTVPIFEEGKHYLEVRGLKKAEDFTRDLGAAGFVSGVAQVTAMKEDTPTRGEKLRAMTLRGTGFIYNIGDLAYLTYAYKGFKGDKEKLGKMRALTEEGVALANAEMRAIAEKKKLTHTDLSKPELVKNAEGAFKGAQLDVGGGIGYAIGGSVLSLFASKDQSQTEIREDSKKLREFVVREGLTVPETSSMSDITKKEKRNPLQKVGDFISKHPSEVLNTVYTGVGILLAAASMKKVKAGWIKGEGFFSPKHQDVRNDVKDIGLGAITMTSALTGLLVKEKKPEPGQPKRTGIGRVWDWIQEKPLRATGVGYFISTLFHAWATYGKYKEGDKFVRDTVKYRGVFVGANVLAEILLFLSSKGHGQGVKADDSVERTVLASAAEIVAQQPHEKQAALMQQLAGHLASPDILGGKAEDIAKDLREQVDHLKQNPWAAARGISNEPTTAAEEHTAPAPHHAAHTPKTKVTHAASHGKHAPAPHAEMASTV